MKNRGLSKARLAGLWLIALVLSLGTASAQNLEYHCSFGVSPTIELKASDFNAQLKDLKPGDTLSISHQKVTGRNFQIRVSGTREKPITIRLSSSVFLVNTLAEIHGNWIRLIGGNWRNSQIVIYGNYNRVSRARFTDGKRGSSKDRLNSAVMVAKDASYNRIDHFSVRRWGRRTFRQHMMKSSKGKGNVFDHNRVTEFPSGSGNGNEVFQIGVAHDDPKLSPGAVIEFNYVKGFSRESELVSLKSNENIVRSNHFAEGKSAIVSRTGSRNQIYGNRLDRTNGVIINGDDNSVFGNYLKGGRIDLVSGDCLATTLQRLGETSKFKGCHPAARRTKVADNRLDGAVLRVGQRARGQNEYYDVQWFPAEGTMIAEKNQKVSRGQRVKGLATGVQIPRKKYGPVSSLENLTGPGAKDAMCQDETHEPKDDMLLKARAIRDEINELIEMIEKRK